jgi:hypothetical protein
MPTLGGVEDFVAADLVEAALPACTAGPSTGCAALVTSIAAEEFIAIQLFAETSEEMSFTGMWEEMSFAGTCEGIW